jgi:enoyl-CoA hydratase/carnithine racemase
LSIEKTCRAIVLTGSGKTFSTGEFIYLSVSGISSSFYLGIDVKYLSTSIVAELSEIDDIGRKAMHVRRTIQGIQNSLRSVDKVNKM